MTSPAISIEPAETSALRSSLISIVSRASRFERRALLENDLFAVHQVLGQLAAFEKLVDTLVTLLLQDTDLVLEVAVKIFFFHPLDIEAALVLVLALAGKDLNVDDRSVDSRRAGKRCVLNVAGLFAEDRTKKFLFRGQLRLALWRDLADEDRARFDLSTDADDAALVEIAKHVLADVRDIASDLFGSELCIAGLDLELLDVDRRVVVVLDEPLGNEDRVLKVVTTPGHECHKHVSAECQFAAVGTRPVGDDLAFLDAFADLRRSDAG